MADILHSIKKKFSRDNFGLVGFLMECECHSGVPCRLENGVRNGFAIRTVIPLGQIRIACSVLWWWFDLDAIDAAATFESKEKIRYF